MKGARGYRRIQLPLALIQRRAQERENTHLTHLYASLVQANQAMLRATGEADLFQDICRICVESGPFGLAWIAVLKEGQPCTAAAAGPMQGYLDGLEVSHDPDNPLGRGPAGRAFRGESVICEDWAEDPQVAPWRERAARFGIRSSGSFPVRTQRGVEAVLTLYADRAGAFQQAKIDLLEELTSNVAFALDKFRAQRERQEEQALYHDLVTALPAGVFRVRVPPIPPIAAGTWQELFLSHYQIEFVSDRSCELIGLDREALQADPSLLLGRLHPGDRASFAERNAEALTHRTPFRWEGRLTEEDGPRWVRFEASPRDLDGGVTLWTGVFQDISEERQAADRLARSHEVLSGIMESAEGPIFSVDRAYRYTSFNKTHAAVMQALYGREVTLGSSLLEHQTVQPDRETTKANLERALAGEAFTEEAMSGEEHLSRLYFEVVHTPIYNTADGKVTGVAVFARNITKRKQLEAEVRNLNRGLERRVEQRTHQLAVAKDELEAFAYSVSHDLRAPLRAISGFAEALSLDADSHLSVDGLQHLQRILGGSNRMAQLIEDLLKLSRIGRDDCAAIPLDLADLAEQVLGGLRSAEPNRLVDCRIQHPIPVQGDPRLLRVLLENLLGNAWKFTARVPSVRIELSARPLGDAMLEISLRDNGAGFPSSQAAKLFTPFHRLHKESDFPGTGIGLAIAKRIVTRHGGFIRAAGEPGLGAAIHFSLPIHMEELP